MNTRLIKLVTKAVDILEICLAVFIIIAILFGVFSLAVNTVQVMLNEPQSFDLGNFLSSSLLLIMGIEFVRMLVLHTPQAVIEVLLFAITREMIITHTNPVDTLMGVVSVALIFAVWKYLYIPKLTKTEESEKKTAIKQTDDVSSGKK